jgi:hypothetical protein
MAATTSQPAVSADFQRARKASGPVSAVSLSLCRASSGSSHPRSGDDPHGPGHGVRVSDRGARVSAQPTAPIFSAAIVPAAKSTSRGPGAVPASGFAAGPAVRRCAASSSGNGSGGSDPLRCGISAATRPPAGRELVGSYRLRPLAGIEIHRPQKEEGAGGFRHHTGPPASFLRSPKRRQGDGSVPRRSGRSRPHR